MRKSAGAQRPPPPEATPGYVPRWVAAQAISDALTYGKPLDDRFPGRRAERRRRSPRFARSGAGALHRHRGDAAARHDPQGARPLLEKGMPRKAGPLESTLIAAAAQILFLEASDHAAVDLAVRAVRADPASAPYVALANAVLRNVARAQGRDPRRRRTARRRSCLARHALEGPLWRGDGARHRRRASAAADARSDREERPGGLGAHGSAAPCCRPVRCGSTPMRRSRSWRASRRANGGCRTPPPRCPRSLLPISPGDRVVDLCAAPGGKTAQLALRGARVSALDRSAQRLKRVASNLERLKLEAELVIANAATYDAPPFDAALVDAPCTSTGTIRRHPDVAWTKRSSRHRRARQGAGRTCSTARSR